MNNITAIVPMKENSERVPGKNLRLMNGKPLFYWIVNELVDCADIICIDTDSEKIASSVASFFPEVQIIMRPYELQGDAISMNDVLAYDLTQINTEYILQTHSTSPLLSAKTIKCAIKTYFDNLDTYDSLYSVSALKARCFTHDGKPINHNPQELIQTQYLAPVYIENSGFYIFSKDSFAPKKRRIGEKPYLFPINFYEAIDIDDEDDFIAAEVLCTAMKG